jgi:prepilin-type N-terminal cleavage/methylation domain-containing protein
MRIRCFQRKDARSGFTLVELLVVMAILAVAMSAMADTVLTITRLGPVNQETGRALDAARGRMETIRAASFDEVYARFNDDPADDPDGPGTAPGRYFAAAMLNLQSDDADGFAGEVRFPEVAGVVREDVDDAALGMPRDLNGDTMIDAGDHSLDCEILPVAVVVEWTGPNGDRRLVLSTQLVQR